MPTPDNDGAFEIIASKVFGTQEGDPDHEDHPNQRIIFGMERGEDYDEEGEPIGTSVGPFIRRADANTGEVLEDYKSRGGDKEMWSAIRQNARNIQIEVGERQTADEQVLSESKGYADVTATRVQLGVEETVNAAAWPNLGPWLAQPTDDVYNSGSNPNGYWRDITATRIAESGKGDGWATVAFDNSSGATQQFVSFSPIVPPNYMTLATNDDYTLMFEFGRVNVSGNVYIHIDNGTTSAFASQKWDTGETSHWALRSSDANTSRTALVKTKSSFSSSVNQMRVGIMVGAGATITALDIRVSMYKGDRRSVSYDKDGNAKYTPLPFTPYVPFGETLNNTAQITINKDSIVSEVAARKVADNPNLGPFFSWPFDDRYNETTNPEGYWSDLNRTRFVEQLNDGWARLSFDNASTSSSQFANWYVRRGFTEITPGEKYTLLLEWRNSTFGNDIFGYTPSANANAQLQGSGSFLNGEAGVIRNTMTAKAAADTQILLMRSYFYVVKAASASEHVTGTVEVRASLYKGDAYSGNYKPYVPDAGEVKEQRTAIIQTKDSIVSLAEGNNTYISPDGTTVTSGMGSKITQTQEAITSEVNNRVASLEPNLSPFYSSLGDEPYWYYWSDTPRPVELGNGWARITLDNTGGSSTIYSYVCVKDIPYDLDTSARPTLLVEIANATYGGSPALSNIWFNPEGTSRTVDGVVYKSLLKGSGTRQFGGKESEIFRIPLSVNDISGNCLTYMWFAVGAGKKAEFDARISLYNGVNIDGRDYLYDGVYKPYADHSTTVENSSRITQTATMIEHEVATRISQDDNMLLDWDAVDEVGNPTLGAVDAKSNRYFSDTGQTQVTCSLFKPSDPPKQGIRTASRFVCDGTYNGDRYRAVAYYSASNFTDLPYRAGQDYTISFWARRTDGVASKVRAAFWMAGSETSSTPSTGSFRYVFEIDSNWTFITTTVNLKSLATNTNRLWVGALFSANSAGTIEICGARMVAGNAPEAVETKMTTKITQTNSAITSLAQMTDTYIDPSTGATIENTAKTYVDQTAENWAVTTVERLEVGGSNLLVGNSAKPFYWTVSAPSGAGFTKTESGTAFNGERWGVSYGFSTVSGCEMMYSPAIQVEVGRQYTVSGYATVNKAYTPASMAEQYKGYGIDVRTNTTAVSNNSSSAGFIAHAVFPTTVANKVKVHTTFTATTSPIYLVLNGGQISDNQTGLSFELDRIKLEAGSKDTDWSVPLGDTATISVAKDLIQLGVESLEIGASNIARKHDAVVKPANYDALKFYLSEPLVSGEQYVLQLWDVDVSHSAKSAEDLGVFVYYCGGAVAFGGWQGTDYFTNGHADHLVLYFTPWSNKAADNAGGNVAARNNLSHSTVVNATTKFITLYNSVPNTSGTMNLTVSKWKLEKGNKATDWSQADEDTNKYISDNSAAIDINRSSITAEVSTRRSAVQPNLSPWFEQPLADVYNAKSNPEGYWQNVTAGRWTNLSGGWGHYSYDNTSGTSTVFIHCRPVSDDRFDTDKTYTLMIELRDAVITGDVYIRSPDGGQFIRSDGSTAIIDTKISTIAYRDIRILGKMRDKSAATHFGFCIRNNAGSKAEFDIRVSFYEGDYTGNYIDSNGVAHTDNPPYKPYNPAALQLYEARTAIIQTDEDVTTLIQNQTVLAKDDTLGIKWNYENFTTSNNGEAYLCRYQRYVQGSDGSYTLNTSPWSDAASEVMFNGVMRTVPKVMLNPNAVLPYNTTIYVVLRLTSASATTGTIYMVWYSAGWKYSVASPSAVGGDWTWVDDRDVVIASFVEPGSEQAFVSCAKYTPSLTSQQLTSGNSAYLNAANAQSTANTANSTANTANSTANTANNKVTAVYGTCSTAAGTAAKVVTCANFVLYTGQRIKVKFSTANTLKGALTLNVNSTGAKTIQVNLADTSTSNPLYWRANAELVFVYNGTQWVLETDLFGPFKTGEVATAAATAAKAVSASTPANFAIVNGTTISAPFKYANTVGNPTLNVWGTGAFPIQAENVNLTANDSYMWSAGDTVNLVFDNGTWEIDMSQVIARMALKTYTVIRDYADGSLVTKTDKTVGAIVNANGSFDIVPVTWDATLTNYDAETQEKYKKLGGKVPSGTITKPYARFSSSGAYWYDGNGVAAANVTASITSGGAVQLGKTGQWHVIVSNSAGFAQYDPNSKVRFKLNNTGAYWYDTADKETTKILASGEVVLGKYASPHLHLTSTDFGFVPANNAFNTNALRNAAYLYASTSSIRIGQYSNAHILLEAQRMRAFDKNNERTWLDFNRTANTAATDTTVEYQYVANKKSFVLPLKASSVTSATIYQTKIDYSGIFPEPSWIEHEQIFTFDSSTNTVTVNPGFPSKLDEGWTCVMEIKYKTVVGDVRTSTYGFGSSADEKSTIHVYGTKQAVFAATVGSSTTSNNASYNIITVNPSTNTYGVNVLIGSGGNVLVGGGESPQSLYNLGIGADGAERLFLSADSDVYLLSNVQDLDNYKMWMFKNNGDTLTPGDIVTYGSIVVGNRTGFNYPIGTVSAQNVRLTCGTSIPISFSYISTAKGGYSLYVPKGLVTEWYPAVVLQTYGGGAWQIGNYNNENLQFVYATKSNVDSQTNTVNVVTLRNTAGTIALTSDLSSYYPLTGGTLTGSISIKRSTVMDIDSETNGLTSNLYQSLYSFDKNNIWYTCYESFAQTNGDISVQLKSRNKKSDGTYVENFLRLRVTKDGTRSVEMSDPEIWDEAIARPASGDIPLNSASAAYSTAQTPRFYKYGRVVHVVGAVKPKAQVAAGGSLTIGQLQNGLRPSQQVDVLCQGSGNNIWLLSIGTNGTMVASRHRNGGTSTAIATDAWLVFSTSFITSTSG